MKPTTLFCKILNHWVYITIKNVTRRTVKQFMTVDWKGMRTEPDKKDVLAKKKNKNAGITPNTIKLLLYFAY